MISPFQLGVIAAAYNFSPLIFNVGFTESQAISDLDPNMWSPFGQLMVLVWGGVFLATGMANDPSTAFAWYAFILEKLVYVIGWIHWHSTHPGLALVQEASASGLSTQVLAPLFHCIYGAGDFVFAILFWKMGNQLQQQKMEKGHFN